MKDDFDKYRVDILAYCLMANPVHLLAVPDTEAGLQRVLKPLRMRYAQRVNRLEYGRGRQWISCQQTLCFIPTEPRRL